MNRLSARALIAALTLSVLVPFAAAQTQQPGYGTPPSGTTTTGTTTTSATPTPNTGVPTAGTAASPTAPVPVGAPVVAPPQPATPLPPSPTSTTGAKPVVFGSQMFSGRFGAVTFSGFNPDYQLAVGDNVLVRLWGAIVYEAVQPIDAQGNIFIPNVGPVKVVGVRNGDLNQLVDTAVKKVFRANVGVYATLQAAQPVKVYVTGFVRAPGLYGGLSSDSVLYYLDRAGGIDPDRGSYLAVDVMRNGKQRARIDLYQFLLKGKIEALQLQDGDTIVVPPRQHSVVVSGEVLNPYQFELNKPQVTAAELMALAQPNPNATHISIVRSIGAERRSEYHPIEKAGEVVIQAGDVVGVTADKYPATILVRIDGAHLGERSFVMPYGSRLKDVVARLKPAPQANIDALQLYRLSVAAKQKESLDQTLRGLEVAALTARSSTMEEATLRKTEADLILQFVERARAIVPKGQVVLASKEQAGETVMEDGDVVRLPERSNLVAVSGEVTFANTLIYNPSYDVDQYVDLVGGYTQRSDRSKILLLRPDGSIAPSGAKPGAGDEIIVFPKVETKWVEVARGITSILYQLAISAKVLTTF
ncbi:polysaccharide biosynthesis/export family protein [Ideonella sp. YS5]|uniref:polysaccharide biosynthesis/export family protein n=1 Tax=Ideonella sp. YS5 TaxID=3453714 RepID=UPI003EE8EC7E